MPALGLDHYNLRAARPLLDELKAFYITAVGLSEGPRPPFASFGYWLYAGGQAVLHLSEARPDEPRPPNNSGTFDHVAFRCADLVAMTARLDTLGIAYRQAEVPQSGTRQLFFRDPAGNGVELNFAAATE
ncbi:VOC family protein [Neisseriaceae bacterium JH1-16]|nr:VOC family protein [Neisseriaceae bacterium JH1-16]